MGTNSIPTTANFDEWITAYNLLAEQADTLQKGMTWRGAVRAYDNTSTTRPSSNPTIDGVVIALGDRVLFSNLSSGTNNNKIWKATTDLGSITWTLETDNTAADGEVTDGDTVPIQEGTAWDDRKVLWTGTAWVDMGLFAKLIGDTSPALGGDLDLNGFAILNETWKTKTSAYTALDGDKIFADTATVGAFIIDAIATPSIGNSFQTADLYSNFETANLTIGRNGSLIMGLAEDFVNNINNFNITFVYSGATKGWIIT